MKSPTPEEIAERSAWACALADEELAGVEHDACREAVMRAYEHLKEKRDRLAAEQRHLATMGIIMIFVLFALHFAVAVR